MIMVELNYPFVKATPQHRLGAVVLDSVFCFLTFYIGYIVWALIVWGQGQTPGKQILRIRVYSADTGRQATWGHMAIRQLLIPIAFSLVFWIPVIIFGGLGAVIQDPFNQDSVDATVGVGIILAYLLALVAGLVDNFWILKGNDRHRVTDILAKTDVLNECIPTNNQIGSYSARLENS
jgi:uncharacterized RDD family membrane protein YckC